MFGRRRLDLASTASFTCLTMAVVLLIRTINPAIAQETAPPAPGKQASRSASDAGPSSRAGGVSVTRADLAAAYLRLEQAYFSDPPTGDTMATINRAFDQATLAFFTGRNAEAIRTIDTLTETLQTKNTKAAPRAVVSLKVAVEPPVWTVGRSMKAMARVRSIYEWPSPDAVELKLQLRLVNSAGRTAAEQPVAVTVGAGRQVDAEVRLQPANQELKPGLYRIELDDHRGPAVIVGRVNVVAGRSLDEQRLANEKRLAEIEPRHAQLTQAMASCRARQSALERSPRGSEFRAIPGRLERASAHEVAAEIDMLAGGENPYSRRHDCWRIFQMGNRPIPLRVYAPQSTANTPLPLLVVLHGMGGTRICFWKRMARALSSGLPMSEDC